MELINSNKLPSSFAPYSRGAIVKDIVFFSGIVGRNSQGELPEGGITAEANAIFSDIEILLNEAKITKENICKMNVYITKMDSDNFAKFNEVYTNWIGAHRPCRTAIGVYSLPKNAQVEIEVIAEKASH
jgi:2-iminobutanoate/2-iminopropanoate deaminase